MSGARYGRPKRGSLLGMMGLNAVLGVVLLLFMLSLFGIREVVAPTALGHTFSGIKWDALWPLVPGMAMAYGCLWFWLVAHARSRPLPWAGACVYGIAIALVNVPVSGIFLGLVHGNPLLYFLMGLVSLLLLPTVLCAMVSFGLAMGILNGILAQRWVDRQNGNA